MENGYSDIGLYFVDLPADEYKSRSLTRWIRDDRYLPIGYLNSIQDRPNTTFDSLKDKEGVTYYAKYDNDVKFGEKAKLIENRGTPQGKREFRQYAQEESSDSRYRSVGGSSGIRGGAVRNEYNGQEISSFFI